MFPLSVAFSGRHFLVFAAQNGNYSRRLLEGVCPSLPTSAGHTGGFLGNAGSAESAGIFAILGKILMGVRHFSKANFTSFLPRFLLGEGPSPGGILLCLRLETVLISGDS